MFRVDKTVVLKIVPHQRTSVDLPILKLVEDYLGFKPLSHVDKKELPALKPNTRRFYIRAAYTQRDK